MIIDSTKTENDLRLTLLIDSEALHSLSCHLLITFTVGFRMFHLLLFVPVPSVIIITASTSLIHGFSANYRSMAELITKRTTMIEPAFLSKSTITCVEVKAEFPMWFTPTVTCSIAIVIVIWGDRVQFIFQAHRPCLL